MIRILLVLALCIQGDFAFANNCSGRFANPVTDVCWSCVFPISIGAAKVARGYNADTTNPKSPICMCGIRPGVSVGFWEPISLVDVTYKPFCMVNLGGLEIAGISDAYPKGSQNTKQGNSNRSFYHVHWYKFPLMLWLNVISSAACVQAGEFDVAYLTELDPTWNSDTLAFILNPEAALFGNIVAQSACAADAVSASAIGKSLSPLFWCAGAQGSMYPLTGHVQEHVSGVQASTLLSERMAYKLHREGLLWDSTGVDGELLCHERPHPIIPKNRYRYQMVYPYPTVGAVLGCQAFGATTVFWEMGKEYPVKGEDFGYLIWRKRNCCAF